MIRKAPERRGDAAQSAAPTGPRHGRGLPTMSSHAQATRGDDAVMTPRRGEDAARQLLGLVVTSPHRVQVGRSAHWQPYGLQHALWPGSSETGCGLPAITWRVFVDLPFDPGHDDACPRCTEKVGRR